MKTIKITVVGLVMSLFMPLLAMGQKTIRYGVEAGVDLSHPTDYARTTGVGFHVGVTGEYDFQSADKGWFMATGLGLISKPWKSETFLTPEKEYSISHESTPYYLRLPLSIGYRFGLTERLGLQINTGLYAAVGLFGKSTQFETIKTDDGNRNFENKVNCFGCNNLYKQFDWGWTSSIGLQYATHWQLKATLDYQFNSFARGNSDIKNLLVGLGISYMF